MDDFRLGTSSKLSSGGQARRRSCFIPSYVLPAIFFDISLTNTTTVPDQASTKITKAFLNTGILPGAQESEFVSVYLPWMTRKPISDSYFVPTGALAGDVDSGNVTVEVSY